MICTNECSTPCGITEGVTRIEARDHFRKQMCSTPCGITEGVTFGGEFRGDPLVVLNALRHHGGRHRRSRPSPRRFRIVLNALRHHGGRHRRVRIRHLPNRRSAQRLAASRRASHSVSGHQELERCVLNALRHHGGRHSAAFASLATALSSAQRLAASRRASRFRASGVTVPIQCSTPCGITEGVTQRE